MWCQFFALDLARVGEFEEAEAEAVLGCSDTTKIKLREYQAIYSTSGSMKVVSLKREGRRGRGIRS